MREMGVELHPRRRNPRSRLASVCLRTSSGFRRKSLPSSSNRSKATRKTSGSWLRCLSLSKLDTPRSLQHTASPSIRQLRTFSLFTARTMSG